MDDAIDDLSPPPPPHMRDMGGFSHAHGDASMMRAVPVGGVLNDDVPDDGVLDGGARDDGFPDDGVLDDGRGGDPPPPVGMLRELGGVRASESHADDLIEEAGLRDRARVLLTPRHAMAIIMVLVAALCASLTLLAIQGLHLAGAGGEAGGGVAGLAQAVGRASSEAGGNPETETPGAKASGAGQSEAEGAAEDCAAACEGAQGDATGETGGDGKSQGTRTDGDASPATDAGTAAGVDGGLIDINAASAEELDEIKGVGPATAEKIIALRKERGGFATVDELLDVPGIGTKTLEKMRPQITVGAGRGG